MPPSAADHRCREKSKVGANPLLAVLLLVATGRTDAFLFAGGTARRADHCATTTASSPTYGTGCASWPRARGLRHCGRHHVVVASVGPAWTPHETRSLMGSSRIDGNGASRHRRLRRDQVTVSNPGLVKRRVEERRGLIIPGSTATDAEAGGETAGAAVGSISREPEDGVPSAGELLVKARSLYEDNFGAPEDTNQVCAGYAPGRVNLIGEHTDYNGGFVMPLALERGTVVYGVGRLVEGTDETSSCRVISENMLSVDCGSSSEVRGDVSFVADESLTPGEPEWANYIKGVVKEFLPKVPAGKRMEFKVTVIGVVPLGGGVSSSASLTMAMATFLSGLLSNAGVAPPSPKEKAHLCRMAEHNFLNMPCGIMDQFVTSMAIEGHAMLLDCRSEQPDAVPLSNPDLVIVVTNSNVKHNLAGSQYPVRVAQCREARDNIRERHPVVKELRDASEEQVAEMEGQVDDAVFRRARHVVTENARTVTAARALLDGDFQSVGRHMLDSHQSLREDYEVSCPELDVLVDLAMEVDGVYGSRMTGGGFGGCTVTLVEKGAVDRLVRHLQEGYSRALDRDCFSFVTKPGFGARGLTGADAALGTQWPDSA